MISGVTILVFRASLEIGIIFVLASAFLFLVGVIVALWSGPPEALTAFKPFEEVEGSFPVEVTVYDRKQITVKDWAYATFVEGWLLVEGLRTSFSLRACDVERLATLDRLGCLLYLQEGQCLQIQPCESDLAFHEAARIWHHFIIESPSGIPVLPPVASHGSAYAKPVFGSFASMATALTGLGISLAGHTFLGTLILVFGGFSFGRSVLILSRLSARIPSLTALNAESRPRINP